MRSKFFRIATLVSVIITVTALWSSCSRSNSTTTTPGQETTVQRGNISTMITGSGNLAFSTTQDLAFGISGQVAEVNVKVGDNITQGQVLARLDTTDLDDAVTSADLAVKSAQINLQVARQAQSKIRDQELTIQSAQLGLVTAQQAQSSMSSAQISLDTATNSLVKVSYPYTYSTFVFDVPAAIVAIHDAQLKLDLASADLQSASTANYGAVLIKFNDAQKSLTEAEQRLGKGADTQALTKTPLPSSGDNITALVGSNPWNTTDYWTLRGVQLAVSQAQLSLDNAKNSYQTGLDKANLTLTQAQQTLEETRSSYQTGLQQSQVNLDTANNNLVKAQRNLAKATITAPFTGVVTAVNSSSGQLVGSGQVAITIADPTKLEAKVQVNEVDIPWVAEGGKVTLQVDAVSALNLPATVTTVSPTAAVTSGVVNYTVTIGLSSTRITPTQSAPTSSNETGQTPSGQGRPTTGQSGQSRTGSRPAQSGAPSTITLRQGLSVTASIVKEQRTNVLLVPSRAISQQGANTYVQIVKSDGTTEQRLVNTGLTDGVSTEITSGLSEGDRIAAQARSTTATTATTTTPAGGAIPFRPGGGLIR